MGILPKVTVLMSVFNRDRYLKQAIESILNQTFKDFEYLIIDDGSHKRTKDILATYNDNRIKIITNDNNIGLTKSLNKGLQIAKGEYVARMDADDVSLPTRLERQVKFLDQYSNVGLLGTWWYVINGEDRETGISKPPNGEQAVHFMCHGSTVIRRICLEKVGFYREVFELAQDYDLWLRIADEFEVANLCEPLYELRIHMDSVSAEKKVEQDLYASLALELAEERRKKGKDRLNDLDHKAAERIRDQRLNISGIEKAKLLSRTYSTWSEASFAIDNYRQALNYAINSLKLYRLNNRALRFLLKSLVKEYYEKPDELIRILYRYIIYSSNTKQMR